jgi:hypothetical protein
MQIAMALMDRCGMGLRWSVGGCAIGMNSRPMGMGFRSYTDRGCTMAIELPLAAVHKKVRNNVRIDEAMRWNEAWQNGGRAEQPERAAN